MKTFGVTSNVLAGLVVSIYLLGFAIGPLVVAPMSEMYGRFMVYNVWNVSAPSGTSIVYLLRHRDHLLPINSRNLKR